VSEEHWICLVGGENTDMIYDTFYCEGRVYFCGSTYSFNREEKGFLGCVEGRKLVWCKVVRGAGYLSRILMETKNSMFAENILAHVLI